MCFYNLFYNPSNIKAIIAITTINDGNKYILQTITYIVESTFKAKNININIANEAIITNPIERIIDKSKNLTLL